MISRLSLLVLLWSLGTVPCTGAEGGEEGLQAEVPSILQQNCCRCHGADKQSGGLRLDSRAAILQGGDSGPAVAPGKPEESPLVEAVRYESWEMPPTGQLPAEQIDKLVRWIEQGAPWSGHQPAAPAKTEKITAEDRAFWSFQPIARPAVPAVDDHGWCRTPVDRFLFDRLRRDGLQPAQEADRRTLVRRVSFDLWGLPPAPDEVEAYGADTSADAYEKLVDRLLASPRYGERWAQHWLDLVRYAESDGFRADGYRPAAWRYRDYVVQAFNDDKPYDRFLSEQLAGDQIAPDDPAALAATGFLRHGAYEYNQRDVRTQWHDIVNEVTDVTGDVFLGLGMGCARCHDHKFDPILQKDYFALQAFFTPILPRDDVPLATAGERAEYEQRLGAWEAATADIRRQIDELERPHRERAARKAIEMFPADIQAMIRTPAGQRAPLEHQLAELAYRQVLFEYDRLALPAEEKARREKLRTELAAAEAQKPEPLPLGLTVSDVGPQAPPTLIPGQRDPAPVEPGFLTVLGGECPTIAPPEAAPNSTGRRAALARWLCDPENPLAARVIVNRVWQHHFGAGLVKTANDFGRLGDRPSHPELLDWLARWFMDEGWSFKKLHRLIVTSAAYRQSALAPAAERARQSDPENRLLWRMNVRRLDAGQIRDAMLAASGELDLRAGGPSVAQAAPRRSVYTRVVRNTRDPLLDAFDQPETFGSCPVRNVTTTATQALLMINGDWTLNRAGALAGLLERESADEAARIELAFRRTVSRPPSEAERELARAFLHRQAALVAGPAAESRQRAWIDFCHVLLNTNEFVYVD